MIHVSTSSILSIFLVIRSFIPKPIMMAAAEYPNTRESDPPPIWSSMIDSGSFDKHCNPFGISIFAKGWSDTNFIHACNMLAQMIDNDLDGCADDVLVVEKMRYNQAGMAMFEKESNPDYGSIPNSFAAQGLFQDETVVECSGEDETSNCRDAAIEEIFHVISQYGIGGAYPEKFSECAGSNSQLTEQLDIARRGHFETVPDSYPDDAVFYYYDVTCDIQCQVRSTYVIGSVSMKHSEK